jgi:regulatory protein
MLTPYEYVMRYLEKYPKTEQELRIKLFQKGYNTEQIERTFVALRKQGRIDDKKYAEAYLNSQIANKGKPMYIIKQKLKQKGIQENMINEYIKKNEKDLQEGIYEKIRKDIKQYKQKGVEWFDIIQKLMKKGYKLDDIKSVIEKRK